MITVETRGAGGGEAAPLSKNTRAWKQRQKKQHQAVTKAPSLHDRNLHCFVGAANFG